MYSVEKLVTLVVKTYSRMDKVLELVSTANTHYPSMPIVAGDDSKDAFKMEEGQKRGFYYVPLSYDIGLSEGRNALLEKVKTPYVLFLDDDFKITSESDLLLMLHELNLGHHDIVAGKSPRCDTDYSGKMIFEQDRLLILPVRIPVAGSLCERVDIVPNIFMARTDLFKRIKWDSQLKLGEHEDFFLRAEKLGIRVATCPSVRFEHEQTTIAQQDPHYKEMRSRVHWYLNVFLRKHGLSQLVAFGKVKARNEEISKIKLLSQTSSFPFSSSIHIEAGSHPHSAYLIHVKDSRNKQIMAHSLQNPDELTSIDFPVEGLDPASTYTVTVKPGNRTHFDENGPSIRIYTIPYEEENLLENPGFDGSTRGWKKSLGTGNVGLIPLFFPEESSSFKRKRVEGAYNHHLLGRKSKWASRNVGSPLNRNYAAFMTAPPIASLDDIRHEFFIYQDVLVEKIPAACRDGSKACSIIGCGWIRVDKIWGKPESTKLSFDIDAIHMDGNSSLHFSKALDPSQNSDWQYAAIEAHDVFLSQRVIKLRVSVRLRCNVGVIFADDFYLRVI